MTTVQDVAAYIVHHYRTEQFVSTMKLEKLAYYSQGWYLALLDEPLFDAEFQAWTYGPVCRGLWSHHKGDAVAVEWPWGNPEALTESQRIVVDAVLKNYGGMSGWQLGNLTHTESGSPWTRIREENGVALGQPANIVIPQEYMKQHFRSVLGGPVVDS